MFWFAVLFLVSLIAVLLLWPFLHKSGAISKRTAWAALGVVGFLAVAVGFFFWQRDDGAPKDFAIAGVPLADQHPEINSLIEKLRARLAAEPQDAQGWLLLARSEAAVGHLAESLAAYRQAFTVWPDAPLALKGDYAETLVAAERRLGPEAQTIFKAVVKADPDDPRARYYLALAKEEEGDAAGALAALLALIKQTPAEAPYRSVLLADAERLAAATGMSLPAELRVSSSPKPGEAKAARSQKPENSSETIEREAAPRGPTAQDVKAAAALSPEERQSMIEGMVAGLAARLEQNPNDPEGWQKLIRAYRVLGREEEAKAAEARLTGLAGR